MKCRHIQEKFSLYRDFLLSKKDAEKVQRHLENCFSCQKEFDRFSRIFDSLALIQDIEVPADLKQSTMQKIAKNSENTVKRQKLTFGGINFNLIKKFTYAIPIILIMFIFSNNTEKIGTKNGARLADEDLKNARAVYSEPIFLQEEIFADISFKAPKSLDEIKNTIKTYSFYIEDETKDSIEIFLTLGDFNHILKNSQILINNLAEIEQNISRISELDKSQPNTFIKFKFYIHS